MTCIAVVSSAMEPIVRKTTVVPLRLARSYEPVIFPTKPIDEELLVGVVLPKFDAGQNALWNEPVSWIGRVDPDTHAEEKALFEVDRVIMNPADAAAAVLPKIFLRLFPRATILQSPECATCDLIFVVDAVSGTVTNSENVLRRLKVTVRANVVTSAGVNVTSFEGEGVGKEAKSIYWSTQTQVRGMGGSALQDAMDRFFIALTEDSSLNALLREKSAARARPSDLETKVAFEDETSLFPNGRLDAGEEARLRFTVHNNGTGPAFAVRLHVGTPAGKITLPQADAEVGDILPGETKTAELVLFATNEVETAHEQLNVDTIERRGFGGRPVIVKIATEQLQRPTLEIADIHLEDRGGRTHADGDGRPSNGEMLEAVILVRNSGPGDAAGAELNLSSSRGLEIIEPPARAGAIPPNAVKELRALVRIPTTFDGTDVALMVRVVETRGASVAMVEKEQRWPVETKRPRVEIAFRVFDGNSPRSSGNRDGVANNGETIEVALVPSNRGKLPARRLRLDLASSVAGLSIKPATLDVGDLPPFAEGTEQRVQITIPRNVARGDLLQRLPLDVAISQTDFAAAGQMIGVPFSALRPRLVAAIITPSALIEGKPATFAIDVRNDGPIASEDVKLSVHSENEAIELLDGSGTPTRVLEITLGSIPAMTAIGRKQLNAFIRRNASELKGSLDATVRQRDFETVETHAALTILKEAPALISTVPSSTPPNSTPPRTAGVPAATVSFLRYRDGSRFHDETIQLAFEVQSQAPLELIRLEQNRRAVELPDTAAMQNAETYLWQYDVPVQLEYGANEFEVVVITAEGVASRRSMTLHREKPRGKIWLAVVGISEYRDPSLVDLEYAAADAVAVHALYRQLGVPNEQIIELLDENATLANIKRTLGTDLVKNAANPDDMVLIYFAGHGEREADRSSADSDGYSKYFLPHDANPADLFGSALSMEELSRILQRLRSERVVLIIDSCFSGAAGGRTPYEPNASRGVITYEFFSRMATSGKGRVILTASDSHEVARETTAMGHGIFTYFLLEGLRGAADIDSDGRVDVDEIYKYLSKKVSEASHGLQNPMRKSPNLTGTLVLGGRLQ